MKIRTCTRLARLVLLAFLAYVPATYAGTATTQFNVTARVGEICSASASTLAFGYYTGNLTDGVTTVSVNCANGLHYMVGLSNGFYSLSTFRRMKHAGSNDYLFYQLYNDPGRSVIWNTNTGRVAGVGTGSAQPLTVFGRLFSGQGGEPVGDYADTITVTVDY